MVIFKKAPISTQLSSKRHPYLHSYLQKGTHIYTTLCNYQLKSTCNFIEWPKNYPNGPKIYKFEKKLQPIFTLIFLPKKLPISTQFFKKATHFYTASAKKATHIYTTSAKKHTHVYTASAKKHTHVYTASAKKHTH